MELNLSISKAIGGGKCHKNAEWKGKEHRKVGFSVGKSGKALLMAPGHRHTLRR